MAEAIITSPIATGNICRPAVDVLGVVHSRNYPHTGGLRLKAAKRAQPHVHIAKLQIAYKTAKMRCSAVAAGTYACCLMACWRFDPSQKNILAVNLSQSHQ